MNNSLRILFTAVIFFFVYSCSKWPAMNSIVGRYQCTINYHSWQFGPDNNSTNTGYAFHSYDSTNATHPDILEIIKGFSANEIKFRKQSFTLTNTSNNIAHFNTKGAPSGLGDHIDFNLKSNEFTFYTEYANHYLQKGYSYYYYGKKID
jgi:hypothetical protein